VQISGVSCVATLEYDRFSSLSFFYSSFSIFFSSHSYYATFILAGILPLVLMGAVAGLYLIPYWTCYGLNKYLPWDKAEFAMAKQRRLRKLTKMMLFTLFLIYPRVASTVLALFVCRSVFAVALLYLLFCVLLLLLCSTSSPTCRTVENFSFLVYDFNIYCYDSQWYSFVGPAIFLIVVYPIGIPVLFYYLLIKNKKSFYDPSTRLSVGFRKCFVFHFCSSLPLMLILVFCVFF
jgi:hypothetical protein